MNRRDLFLSVLGIAAATLALPGVAQSRKTTLSYVDQAYYWKHAWQVGERESLAELATGQGRVFAEPAEAARYLLSTDDVAISSDVDGAIRGLTAVDQRINGAMAGFPKPILIGTEAEAGAFLDRMAQLIAASQRR